MIIFLEKCNLIKFVNNYGHPVIISRGVNSHGSKEFKVEGKSYKLKTVIKNVQKTDKIEPVVYTAKDGRKDVGKKLLLGERDSFSLIPGDCDGEFIDVVISSQTNLPPKGIFFAYFASWLGIINNLLYSLKIIEVQVLSNTPRKTSEICLEKQRKCQISKLM